MYMYMYIMYHYDVLISNRQMRQLCTLTQQQRRKCITSEKLIFGPNTVSFFYFSAQHSGDGPLLMQCIVPELGRRGAVVLFVHIRFGCHTFKMTRKISAVRCCHIPTLRQKMNFNINAQCNALVNRLPMKLNENRIQPADLYLIVIFLILLSIALHFHTKNIKTFFHSN